MNRFVIKGCHHLIIIILAGCNDSPSVSMLSRNTIDRIQSEHIECHVHVEEFSLDVTIRDESGAQHVLIPDSEIVKVSDARTFFVIPFDETLGMNIINSDYLILDDTTILVSAMDFKYRINTYVIFKDERGVWSNRNLTGSSMLNGAVKLDCECAGVFVDPKRRLAAVHTSPIPLDESLDRFYVSVFFYEIESDGFKYIEEVQVDYSTLLSLIASGEHKYEAELYSMAHGLIFKQSN